MNTKKEEKSLAIRGTYNVASPEQASSMANALKSYIVKQKLYTNIKGKNFAHVDGWQYAGSLMKTYPKVSKVENLSTEKEIKWKADVEIINIEDGMVVGFGTALCSNKEKIKLSFEEYAILSMAQTRAIGKAYRNRVGWIMKLAGYESTPSEEITENMVKNDGLKKEDQPMTEKEIAKILDMVKIATDKKGLQDIKVKIFNSSRCSDEQKSMLVDMIDAKIETL